MWSRLAVSGAGRVPQLCVASPVGPSLGREGWWELCGEGCLVACLALGCGRSSQQERLDLGHHAHCGATPASPGMVSLPSVSSVFGWTQPGLPPVATQAQAEDGGGGGSRPSGRLSARLCSPSSGLKPLEPTEGEGHPCTTSLVFVLGGASFAVFLRQLLTDSFPSLDPLSKEGDVQGTGPAQGPVPMSPWRPEPAGLLAAFENVRS